VEVNMNPFPRPPRPRTIALTLGDGTPVHTNPRNIEFVFDTGRRSSEDKMHTRVTLSRISGGVPGPGGMPLFYLDVREPAQEVLDLLYLPEEDSAVARMRAHLRAIVDRYPELSEYPERDVALMYENLWALNETIAAGIVSGGSLLAQCMRQRDPASPNGLWIAPDMALALMRAAQ
jgi:hypothetical protein